MPEYLHPGVYVEETSFRAKPIEGVSTSTAGLVGRTPKGVEGRPTLVTSFTQFVREFGQPFSVPEQLGDYLGHAMRAFFENGGRRAYVVRALANDARPAHSGELPGGTRIGLGTVLRLPATATVIGPTDILPLDTLRNVDLTPGTDLQIWTRSTATTAATLRSTVTVTDYDASRNSVRVSPGFPPGTVLNPMATFVRVVNVAPQTGHVDGPIARARSRGAGGNNIAVEIRPRDLPAVRLGTRRYHRNRPTLASFVVPTRPGPNTGDPTFDLLAAEVQQLRVGDTIRFSNGTDQDEHTVSAIEPGTITFTAPPAGTYNVGARVELLRRVVAAPNAPSPVTLYVFAGTDTMTLGAGAIAAPHGMTAVLRNGDRVRLSGGGGPSVDLEVTATTVTTPNTVEIATPAAHDFRTSTLTLERTATATGTTRLVIGDVTGLTANYRTGSFEPIGVTAGAATETSAIQLVDATTNQVYVTRNPGAGTFPQTVTNANWTSFESLQAAPNNAQTFPVASTSGFYIGAIVEVDDGEQKYPRVVTGVDPANRLVTVGAAVPDPVDVHVDPARRRAFIRAVEIDVLVYEREGGALQLKETFPNLTWNHDPAAASFARYYVARINDRELGSKLITFDPPAGVPPPPTPTSQPTTDEGFPVFLFDGDDGSPLSAVDLIGRDEGPNQRFGIQALVERKDIALVAVPGVTDEIVQQALITHCELMKYRFAVLDGRPDEEVVTDILAHRNNYDSKYAGYYAPWLTTVDLTTGRTLVVPPSGHVLGICARVDNERGVHKAPANETVRGILDVELPFTDGEQDVLNPLGVNLIRELEGRGIRVWGARTISSDPEWKYVNVRRLFIFLEHSIDNGTQWVVFEPNNEALWARVKATIESFLFGVWKTGALMGTKPEDAYFVRCDRSTMTQDDIDNGRLVCLIGVAPTYPAEFVIFRIGQFTASSNLS